MAIQDTIKDVQSSLQEILRKHKFKKANLARAEQAELQYSLGKCRGKLEVSSSDFKRTIRVQAKNIREGIAAHQDTVLQEQILWDAAIGYMLVQDAVYALKSINSYDSVSHAYEYLDAAVKQMAGKKASVPKALGFRDSKDRNRFGYVTSDAAVKEKEDLLDGIFEELKQTGDIDACITKAQSGELRSSGRMSSLDDLRSQLGGSMSLDAFEPDADALSAMRDPSAPV